MFRKSGKGI